ncbi:MAG TPA: 23S rRNA (adenine(2030)-N(6))-methyltransferase RlmJ [Magnetospirillum sp.]|jgi:23S rRNA (adenine2030-N6)-methyltransferase|nr:23S rRNA (adenine(2030)-N(6))-methyltransferase RlmJ [Magnetospirillum sp.]
MNYRHAYHAGNFADVQKHAVLALVVEHLKRKEGAFCYLDTHAGIGAYDLASVQAEKTGEWRSGIGRVMAEADPPAELKPYQDAVAALNPQGGLQFYPGSPALVAALARPQDRLALCELHPEDSAALRHRFAADPRVGVHHMDGYVACKSLLPPPERRGLVLMDPPFEVKDEFARMRQGLAQALKRWPTGLYALWYPIKAREPVARFHADLAMLGLPKSLVAEVMIAGDDAPDRLNGAGLVLVNPPWKLDESLAALLPWLARVLAPDTGFSRLEWLVPEQS